MMILRVGAGVVFILLGIIGLFLPFLQGIVFLAIGTGLLAPHVPFFRRVRDALRRRVPPALRRRLRVLRR